MKNRLATSSVILILLTLLSKLLVVARDMGLAYIFGASAASDAYMTAISILSMVSVAALAALTVSYIPIITSAPEGEVSHITNNFIGVLSALVLLFSAAAMFFTEDLVRLFASGFSRETISMSAQVLRVVLPFLFFSVALNISIAYLQFRGRFAYQGLSAVVANVIIIISIFLSKKSLVVLAVGYALSIAVPAVVGLYMIDRQGLRLRLVYSPRDAAIKEMLIMSTPIFISQVFLQLNIIVNKNFASIIGEGILTDLDYAYKISTLLVTSLITPIATVLFPSLTKSSVENNYRAYGDIVGRSLQFTSFLMMPITIGVALLAEPMINLLFLRGAYSAEAALVTARALICYAALIPASGYIYIMNNAFFALKDTRTPVYCGAIAVVVNIALNFALVTPFSYVGLAVATSVATILNATMYLVMLRRKVGDFGIHAFLAHLSKIVLCTIMMGIAVYFLKAPLLQWSTSTPQMITALAAIVFIGAIVYYFFGVLLRIPEICIINTKLHEWLLRRKKF